MNYAFYKEGGCQDQIVECYESETVESNKICYDADDFCVSIPLGFSPDESLGLIYICLTKLANIQGPAVGDLDQYDLRQNASSPNPFPPTYYVNFLQNTATLKKIGAQVNYSDCSDPVLGQFNSTGDDARTLLPRLGALADSGLRILIWAGDTDIK